MLNNQQDRIFNFIKASKSVPTLQEMASVFGISRQGIHYHIKKMERMGILKTSRTHDVKYAGVQLADIPYQELSFVTYVNASPLPVHAKKKYPPTAKKKYPRTAKKVYRNSFDLKTLR